MIISNSLIISLHRKTRILHQHEVWERNYRDCGAKVLLFSDIRKYFEGKCKKNAFFCVTAWIWQFEVLSLQPTLKNMRLSGNKMNSRRQVALFERNPICRLCYGICLDLADDYGSVQFEMLQSLEVADALCERILRHPRDCLSPVPMWQIPLRLFRLPLTKSASTPIISDPTARSTRRNYLLPF